MRGQVRGLIAMIVGRCGFVSS